MEIAQTMIGNHLQHPLGGPGAIIYPGKGSAWQPVVTSLPSMVDIPKESIIANTDFTTTSVIAKRRLSSKKRKKVASQQQGGEGGSGSSDQHQSSSSHSPVGSANGSPAVTSTTYTPPANFDKSNQTQDDSISRSTSASISSQNVMTSSHAGITSSSSTHLPHHMGPHPPVTVSAGGVQFHHAGGQFISVAPAVSGAYHHPTVATAQTQFANPMLSQLQQELNYRFLQDRSSGLLVAHPNSQVDHSQHQQPPPLRQQQQLHGHGFKHLQQPTRKDSGQAMDTSVAPPPAVGGRQRQPGFKWCYAHVTIAKQIQQQQRAKELSAATSSSSSSAIALNQSHMTQSQANPVASVAAAHHQHQQQQQQQQLALLQMYGLPAASAVPTAVPGYMAVPYSSMQEVQLRMHQLAAANATGASLHPGVSLVKPVGMDSMTAESLLSLNPTAAAATAGTVQMVNGLHLQAAPFAAHTVPLAAVAAAPSDLNNAMFHGAASGQWMAPTVPVVGSCIVNPLQPHIMATPWVK